jgi:hypothetical protein
MKWNKYLLGALAVLAVGTVGANAQVFTLTDFNSVFNIDSFNGAQDWLVEGVDQLYEQGFWFGIGSTSPEQQLGSYFTNGWVDASGRVATLQFTHTMFTAEIMYILTGGTPGSSTSDVAETIRIVNTSREALPLRFFQYCDFDLNNTISNDRVTFVNANTVRQFDSGGGPNLSETVVTPAPSHYEGNLFANTRNSLMDGATTILSDMPAIGASLSGDVTWAYEWDRTINHGGSFLISKDKHMDTVPEPGTLILLGLGLCGVEVLRRRRNKA